jgi:hypothetical protein
LPMGTALGLRPTRLLVRTLWWLLSSLCLSPVCLSPLCLSPPLLAPLVANENDQTASGYKLGAIFLLRSSARHSQEIHPAGGGVCLEKPVSPMNCPQIDEERARRRRRPWSVATTTSERAMSRTKGAGEQRLGRDRHEERLEERCSPRRTDYAQDVRFGSEAEDWSTHHAGLLCI